VLPIHTRKYDPPFESASCEVFLLPQGSLLPSQCTNVSQSVLRSSMPATWKHITFRCLTCKHTPRGAS
ncbi:unnamed protein product, partial [Staurois parvus]